MPAKIVGEGGAARAAAAKRPVSVYFELNKLILRTFCARQSKSQTLFCIIYGQVISVFKTAGQAVPGGVAGAEVGYRMGSWELVEAMANRKQTNIVYN